MRLFKNKKSVFKKTDLHF